MQKILGIILLFICSYGYSSTIKIVEKGKPKSRIIIYDGNSSNVIAANLLQQFLKESSTATIPIVNNTSPSKGDIVIGDVVGDEISEDGFRLQTRNGVMYIGGKDKGVIYGVITLLEKSLNADYYAANVYKLDKHSTILLSEIDTIANPAFRYRQSQAYGMSQDSVYRMWLRFEEPRDVFAGGYWVHTFNSIMPSSEFGDSHPEYYSYINGMRRPGNASQWCLTNNDVFEIVAHRVDSIFKANPNKKIISISQNDSNHTYCRCTECEIINEYEDAPVGNYIRFMNKLAERFPDKEFSTLAYLFTMKPPKHVKPLPNVNIMLCDIDCFREVPLTDNASGKEFIEAMEGWSAISNNIFVWDYGINFDNMVAPFPNFPILRPNIELFMKNNATMHFSQIGGSYGGDFSEMRSYIVSKLMWNPNQDVDSIMLQFMNNYYGAAAMYIYNYEKMLEGGLLASGKPLWIYDSPVSHAKGMLNDNSRKKYNLIFDQAEKSVENDPILLKRVRMARLPLLYSDLEIARTKTDKDIEDVINKLNVFEKYVTEFDIKTLNERNNSPVEYCKLYRTRYLPSGKENKALHSKITWQTPPTGKYINDGEKFITDGLFGGASFTDSWTGWEGIDAAFTIDMGEIKKFSEIETDFLHQLGQWILLPRSVEYSISQDGKEFTSFGKVEFEEDRSGPVKFVPATVKKEIENSARYIKVNIEGVKISPSWHYGVGYPCWFFLDEVTVR